MSEQTLTIALVPRRSLPVRYWIKLEQILIEEEATLQEATETIDTIFDLEPCVEDTEDPDEPIEDYEEQIEEARDNYIEKIAPELQEELCDQGPGFTTQVKLFRSHQNRPYTILPQGGTVTQTILGNADSINTVVKIANSESLSMDLPGDQTITAAWQGTCYNDDGPVSQNPPITVDGGNVYWDGAVTGTMSLRYLLPYDLLTVVTDGEDCVLTALYHLSVDEIELKPPPEDPQVEELCKDLGGIVIIPPDTGDCLIETDNRILCDCSGRDTGKGEKTYATAACPEGIAPGTVIQWKNSASYVFCPGEEDEVNDPKFYEQKCCDPPPWPLPRCRNKKQVWNGTGLDPERQEELLRTWGPRAQIVMVGPARPPCGILTHEQDVNAKNCCEDVPPLEPDPNNPTTIAPSSVQELKILLGTGSPWVDEWIWTASGSLRFANGLNMIVGGNKQLVFAPEDLCANNIIRVEDGCSDVSMPLAAEDTIPLEIPFEIRTVSPDGYIAIEAVGGVEPLLWSSGGGLVLISAAGRTALFQAAPDFCGSETVNVSDACTEVASCYVASIQGHWENVFVDQCTCPSGGPGVITDYFEPPYFPKFGIKSDGRYECLIQMVPEGNWDYSCAPMPCNNTDFIEGMNAQFCNDFVAYYGYNVTNGTCCVLNPGEGQPLQYYERYQIVASAKEWVCP